jgi:predicted ester cyclase
MQPNRLSAIISVLFAAVILSCNHLTNEQTATDTTAKNADAKKIELVKSFYPALEKGDWATIEKLIASDFTDHSPWMPPAGVVGRDSAMIGLKSYREGFPNMKYELLHTAIDNDIVFVQYRFTGSNDGPFMGMPATNKKVDYTGVDMVSVKDSLITAHWDYGDNITYMKQMGLMPECEYYFF